MQSLNHTYATVHNVTPRDAILFDPFVSDPRDVIKCRVMVRHALRHGGVTMTRGYDPIAPGGRYIVGGKYPGIVRDASLPLDVLAHDLERYVRQSPSYIVPTFVGLWVADGAIFIDTVTAHDELGDTFDIARKRHQIAVYDTLLDIDYPVVYLPWDIVQGSTHDIDTGDKVPHPPLACKAAGAWKIERKIGGGWFDLQNDNGARIRARLV